MAVCKVYTRLLWPLFEKIQKKGTFQNPKVKYQNAVI